MVTVCIKNGKIKQEVSLVLVALVAIIFIVVGGLGTQIISDIQQKKQDVCSRYVQYPTTVHVDYYAVYVVCLLVSIVLILMSISIVVKIFFIDKIRRNYFSNLIVPLVLLAGGVVSIGVCVKFYNDYSNYQKVSFPILNFSTDAKLLDYCGNKDTYTDNMYAAFSSLFALGVIGFFLYIYNFVTTICVSA